MQSFLHARTIQLRITNNLVLDPRPCSLQVLRLLHTTAHVLLKGLSTAHTSSSHPVMLPRFTVEPHTFLVASSMLYAATPCAAFLQRASSQHIRFPCYSAPANAAHASCFHGSRQDTTGHKTRALCLPMLPVLMLVLLVDTVLRTQWAGYAGAALLRHLPSILVNH
jgi:hypothetical protein